MRRTNSRFPGALRQPPAALVVAALTGVALVGIALLTGCAQRPATGATPAAGAAGAGAPALLRTTELRLPLDAYQPTLAQYARLAVANRALVRRCMRALGYDYVVAEPATAGPATWNERRYGLSDPAPAEHGYWPASRVAPSRPRHTATTPAMTAAVTGVGARDSRVPAGGCSAQAFRELTAHDPPGADRYLAQRLSSDSFFGSRRDPTVEAATREWSACMAAAGFSYSGPLDPPRDERFQGPAAAPLEVATARADVACKQRSNLIGTWYATESARQVALVTANQPALELARDAFAAELAVAAGVGA
jgi:hypothetical protein